MSDQIEISPDEGLSLRAAQVYKAAEQGAIVEVDPVLADFMGASEDDAMGMDDALASRFDHLPEVNDGDE